MQDQTIVKAQAHCDAPCGIYDPASARIAVEAVVSMTKKLLALEAPNHSNKEAFTAYLNTFARYSQVKEEQSQIAKTELLVLWTDYFKDVHLETYPDLHDTFWKAAKLCSSCKVETNLDHANELLDCVKKIHDMFWATKGRDVAWYLAG